HSSRATRGVLMPPRRCTEMRVHGTPGARCQPVALLSRTSRESTMITTALRRALQITLLSAASAAAQSSAVGEPVPSDTAEWVRRSAVIVSFVQSRPQGAFAHNIGLGYGVDGAYLFRIDGAGIWSLRANVGIISY